MIVAAFHLRCLMLLSLAIRSDLPTQGRTLADAFGRSCNLDLARVSGLQTSNLGGPRTLKRQWSFTTGAPPLRAASTLYLCITAHAVPASSCATQTALDAPAPGRHVRFPMHTRLMLGSSFCGRSSIATHSSRTLNTQRHPSTLLRSLGQPARYVYSHANISTYLSDTSRAAHSCRSYARAVRAARLGSDQPFAAVSCVLDPHGRGVQYTPRTTIPAVARDIIRRQVSGKLARR